MDFNDLLERLEPKLRAISRKVQFCYTYCDKDDFLQEALLYLWIRQREGVWDDKTESYVLQGCYFFLKNYIRRICKMVDKRSVSINTPLSGDTESILEHIMIDEKTLNSEDSMDIYMMLDESEEAMTEREKEVLCLKIEGKTTREIGARFGVSHVAIVKLQKNIREKCGIIKDEIMVG